MNFKNIKAVLFDMDGVIIDSMKYHAECWVEIFSLNGIEITQEDILIKEGIKPFQLIKETFQENGIDLFNEKIERILKSKMDNFWKKYKPKLFPQIINIFDKLKRKNISIALVTGSTGKSINKVLNEFSLHKYIDYVVHSDLVTKGKPHPMSFQRAVEGLNLKPEECICIENAPYGIRSAKSAGIITCAITTTLKKNILLEAGADIVIENHSDIINLLR